MTILSGGKVHPNGNGAQVYLPADLVTGFGMPFGQRDEYLALTVPHVGVLLFPRDQPPDFPVSVDHPQRIDPQLDLTETTIPCSPPPSDD
jgi:hypothetical protein